MQLFRAFFLSFLFLLGVFAFDRAVFLASYFPLVSNEGISVIFGFWKGLLLDISTASILMGIPLVFLLAQWFIATNFFFLVLTRYVQCVTVLAGLIFAGEIVMYDEWMMKLHYKIFVHLSNPSEVFHSAHSGHYIKFGIALLVMLLPLLFYNIFLSPKIKNGHIRSGINVGLQTWLSRLCILASIAGLLVIGMRGGLQPIPINQSHCYYSTNNVLNEAAVNPLWNLFHSIIENKKNMGNTNPYRFYKKEEAAATFKRVHQYKENSGENIMDSVFNTPEILETKQPNIVILIMESWSSDIIGTLGGMEGVTPNFDSLAERGLLFSNIYATGKTSDQGIPAILSSFHSLPTTSIVSQPNKYRQLSCTNTSLKVGGYHSSFYFGGQLIYGNIKGYLYYHGFDKIIEQADMDPDLPAGKLGIHDEYVMDRQLKDLSEQQQPFFSVLFTLSTHPPYDMPLKTFKDYAEIENSYLNAAHYTDSCLGVYFNKAKTMDWYQNTLFVILADHSHKTHKQRNFCAPAHFKIPMLFYGEAIKTEFKGEKIEKIGSQVDVNATLLRQLDIPAGVFNWSKDLLHPRSPGFAFYSWYDGYAWVTPRGHFAYENRFQKYFHLVTDSSITNEQLIIEGRSYLQHTFEQYLEY